MTIAIEQVVFTAPYSEESKYNLSLELDGERNGDRSSFRPGRDTCYIRCYPALPGVVYRATQGSVSVIGEYPHRIDETIVITGERGHLTGVPMAHASGVIPTSPAGGSHGPPQPFFGSILRTLRKIDPPRISPHARIDGIEWRWLGYDPGIEPLFVHGEVLLPRKVNAVLWVQYTTYYTLLAHVNSTPDAPPCNSDPCECPAAVALVSAQLGDTVATIEVNWDMSHCHEMTDITVTDMCSGNPIKGAMVYVDGKYAGMTNEQGVLRVPLSPGKHTISATAMGYRPTASDEVRNEEFNI